VKREEYLVLRIAYCCFAVGEPALEGAGIVVIAQDLPFVVVVVDIVGVGYQIDLFPERRRGQAYP